MTEFEQLCYMLNDEFLSDSQDVMIEDKEKKHKIQCVKIEDGNRKGLIRRLYRFDLKKKDFLPFFNKANHSPVGLCKFCDYVLLVSYKNKTYILLIELKRGDTYGADKQLRASEFFIEFLCKTAKRLHEDFGDFDFDHRNIVLRKIRIKACRSNKTSIKLSQIDTSKDIIPIESSGLFPLARFLN